MASTSRFAFRQIALFLLIIPLLALACRFGQAPEPSALPTVVPIATAIVPVVAVPASNEETTLVNLYARANPAVVNITIYARSNGSLMPLGQGSGWLYDNDRHFVTNAHVVQEAEQIEVTFSDGSISAAELVGIDLNSDLAVVQAEKVPEGVLPLPLGSMGQLAVGQTVVAIGNPFGLNGTLTRGIISALGRDIPALNQFAIPQSIQTDAAINPGNSGGPLLNLSGQVIGVNAQIQTDGTVAANAGVGFAIPVSVIERTIPELISNGSVEWSYLGVRGGTLSPAAVKAMDLPVEQGAYLSEVVEGGAASKAGLQGSTDVADVDGRQVEVGGDIVTAIDGQPVRNFDDMLVYIALSTRPGQEVTLTIVRNGQAQDVKVTLGSR
jgi:2-alkenal reductase